MASLLVAASVSAQSISVNMGSDRAVVNEAGKTSGALLVDGAYWNNASGGSGTLTGLLDSTGTATSANITWSSANTWQSGSTGATATSENGDLTKGYLDDGGAGWSVNINSPYLLSNIYVIHATDSSGTMAAVSVNGLYYKGDGSGSTVSATGSSDSWSGSAWSSADTLTESDNYLKISNQSAVSVSGANSGSRSALAGIQIENAYTGTLSYWDTNGATAGAGGANPSGNWTDASWSGSDLGTDATTAWTSGNAAVFAAGSDATGAYTVTLTGTQNADAVWVQEGNVTLTGGTLALGATGVLRADDSSSLTVSSDISTSNLNTVGTINLNGASNSVTGVASIEGTTTLGAVNTWGNLAGSGILNLDVHDLTVGDATDSTFGGSFEGDGSITKQGTGNLTLTNLSDNWFGNFTVDEGTLTMDTGGILAWYVDGAGNFRKTGTGTLVVDGEITTTGTLSIDGGTLQIGANDPNGLISGQSSISITNNAMLSYNRAGADAEITADVTFGSSNAQIRQAAGANSANKLTITNATIAGGVIFSDVF